MLFRSLGEATAYNHQALELARAIGSAWDEAHALAGLGRSALAAGRTAEAGRTLRQALVIFERIGAAEAADLSAELGVLGSSPPDCASRRSRLPGRACRVDAGWSAS